MEMDRVKMRKIKEVRKVSKSGERKGKVRMRFQRARTKGMLLGYLGTSVRRKSNNRSAEFVDVEVKRMKPMRTMRIVKKAAKRCHHLPMSICLSRKARMSGTHIFVRT